MEKMWNQSYNHSDKASERFSPHSTILDEGEIAGVLIGCVFVVFLVLPVALSYILVYCKRLHVHWKNTREHCYGGRTGSENAIELGGHIQTYQDDQTETMIVDQEQLLPNAELSQSEPPPSYTVVMNSDLGSDAPFPPEYNSAISMEKV